MAYMGDDERFDYMYKFVSRRRYRPGDKKHNLRLLSDGDLYVAKFTGDGCRRRPVRRHRRVAAPRARAASRRCPA